MKNICILLLVLISTISGQAQDFNNYKPLKATGIIPKEFITASSEKYATEIEGLGKNNDKEEVRTKKEYLLSSNFAIDEILQSGMVLFNDPLTLYLTKVAQEVCGTDQALREKVRVYAIRSSGVNAFATNRGTVFVTIGLLAQLENEAQLAFIIAHELVHVREGHSMDLFLKAKSLEKSTSSKKTFKNLSIDDDLFNANQYSKELESEADVEGLELLLKTNYSTDGLENVFDVLKYAYLPFDEIPFDLSYLERNSFNFPASYTLAKVKDITGESEDEDDSESSHPNIAKRRAAVQELLKKANNDNKVKYIVSRESFEQMRDIARFEIPSYHLHNDNPYATIYSTYLLSKKYPESQYLKKLTVQALYIQAKFKNQSYSYALDYKEVEGESQRVLFLLDTLTDSETTILAARHVFDYHKKYPQDKDVELIVQDIFVELADHYDNLDMFQNTPYIPAPDSVVTPVEAKPQTPDDGEKSKYDRIKEKKVETNTNSEQSEYWAYAFVGLLDDPDFKEYYKKAKDILDKRKERKTYYKSAKGRSEIRKSQRIAERNGISLGIKDIVVVNPQYISFDNRPDKKEFKYLQGESYQEAFRNAYTKNGKRLKMNVKVLDVSQLTENDVEAFNDIKALNEWFTEQTNHNDLTLTPGFNQAAINEIAKKYNTKYFLWTGVVNIRDLKSNTGLNLLYGIIYPVILPYMLYKVIRPYNEMLFMAILYDVEEGRYEVVKLATFAQKANKNMLTGHVYDTLLQIQRKPKKG